MQKKSLRLYILILTVFSLLFSSSIAAASGFSDTAGHWAENEINYLAGLGIINGYPNGTFGVGSAITRAEVAAIITNEMGLSEQTAGYPDVSASHWANGKIGAVTAANIMSGYPNGDFKPDTPMTRAEVAKVLDAAYQLAASPPSSSPFSDVGTAHWSYLHIAALFENNITAGYPNGTYKPEISITRAEFAVFIARVLDAQFSESVYLTNRARTIIEILNNEDMAALEPYVHPTDGVRFSPYEYVTNTHLIFPAASIPGLLNDSTIYTWGIEDGSGLDIDKNAQDYFNRYVNRKDYTTPDDIQYNNLVQRGNMINNIPSFYPGASFVEFHVYGTSQYSGMDWGSLFIVFEQYNGQWYITGIVNGEWTT